MVLGGGASGALVPAQDPRTLNQELQQTVGRDVFSGFAAQWPRHD